jgi:hypothetical protein
MGELLAQIRNRRERGKATRLLFDGPPGGGKTQGALYLAREAGAEAVVYRPSDLLSPFVGVAEKNIARMFREAEERGTLLVLDEADALLTDRGNARRSWELTQAAEFLQGLQEFGGTLIACTNRLTAIDSALRRRFHQCVTFGPLPPELTEEALWHLFPGLPFAPAHLKELTAGPPLMMSDLANAAELLDHESFSLAGAEDGPRDRDAAGDDGSSPEAQGARPAERSPDAERFPDTERVVRAILANAKSRDMSRSIGF